MPAKPPKNPSRRPAEPSPGVKKTLLPAPLYLASGVERILDRWTQDARGVNRDPEPGAYPVPPAPPHVAARWVVESVVLLLREREPLPPSAADFLAEALEQILGGEADARRAFRLTRPPGSGRPAVPFEVAMKLQPLVLHHARRVDWSEGRPAVVLARVVEKAASDVHLDPKTVRKLIGKDWLDLVRDVFASR